MKKGKTESGFKYEIDEKVLDDMELIDAMAASQGDDPTQISTVVVKIFGVDQRKKLYDLGRRILIDLKKKRDAKKAAEKHD